MYFDNGLLQFWYDSWLVLFFYAVAIVLTLLVINKSPWKDLGFVMNLILLIGIVAALPLVLGRVGIKVAVDNPTSLGVLNLIASISTIVLALGYQYYMRRARAAISSPGEEQTPPAQPSPGTTSQVESPAENATIMPEPEAFTSAPTPGPDVAPTAWLHIQSGNMAGQTIPISSDATSIGRAVDNDLVLDDESVSRVHARISYSDGQFFVEDQQSSGGTLVEGLTSPRSVLETGATLQIGGTEMIFMQTEQPPDEFSASTPQPSSGAGETLVMMTKPETVMAWLAVTTGPNKGTTYQLKEGPNTIGRSDDNDLTIPDASVSRSHALVTVQGEDYVIVDLGSNRGTKVGSLELRGRKIRSGSVIRVGQTTLNVVQIDQEETAPQISSSSSATMVEMPQSGNAVLIAQSGPDAGKSFHIAEGDNVIGREVGSTINLADDTVSRRHAMIRCQGDNFVVFDMGSRTGTQVDGESLSGYTLSSGDRISIGNTEIVLMQPQI